MLIRRGEGTELLVQAFYGHVCVAVETREHPDAFYAGRASVSKRTFINKLSGPFERRRREKQKHKLHSKLSSTNIRVILKDRQLY